MCLCQVSLLSRCGPRYLTCSSRESCKLFIWKAKQVSLRVVNLTWTNLDPLALILHFSNGFRIAARLVCSFCEAMAGLLFVANTTVSSKKVAVVDSGEVGRFAVYIRYNKALKN
jgi:hypothetical protein